MQFLWDDKLSGFGLRVTPNGGMSYVYQYRMGGREARVRRHTIGKHGSPWTPDSARDEAKRLALLVGQGIDPIDADKDRRRRAVDLAFKPYVETFAKGYLEPRWKSSKASKAMLVRDAVPVLGHKPLPDIKRSDFTALWDRMATRPAQARLMHATLRKLFRWAISRGDIERSPLEGSEAPPAVATRDRVLCDDELGWTWAAASMLVPPFDGFIQLLILTGQRRQEVAGLQWEELSRSSALWALPAERAKNGETHLVPLSALAVAVLDSTAAGDKWPKRGLVFSTTGKTPISGFGKAKSRLDAKMAEIVAEAAREAGAGDPQPIPGWVLHDLRRTVATGLQRLGVRFEVTEAVLNHVSGAKGGIAGVYQRHDWKDEKRAALEAWGAHVRRLQHA